MTDDNATLDLVNINACIIFGEILSICSQDIELKQKSDINQGVRNLRIITGNNLNLDLVNINACTQCGLIQSMSSKDIERKRNSDISYWP